LERRARDTEWSDLMRAAIAGDAAAYRGLLSSVSHALRPKVRRHLLNSGDAEDVVQDVLLAIHMKRHTWDQEKPIGPWIMAIARNKVIDEIRRRGRRAEVPIENFLEVLEGEGNDQAIAEHDAARVLDGLKGRARDIVQAIAIDGASTRDVAERLGMTEVAVRVALHRTLKGLASKFQEKPTT